MRYQGSGWSGCADTGLTAHTEDAASRTSVRLAAARAVRVERSGGIFSAALGQLVEQLVRKLHALFTFCQMRATAKPRSPRQLVSGRVGLHKRYQRHGVDGCRIPEIDGTTLGAELNAGDAQVLRPVAKASNGKQVAHRLREQAKTVDHLDLQFAQPRVVLRGGYPLVKDKPRIGVGQVALGDQCRHMQVDVGARLQWRIEVGDLAAPKRRDGTLQHFHIHAEADALYLPALIVSEQLAGATDFKVMCRQLIAGSKITRCLKGLQPLCRIRGD